MSNLTSQDLAAIMRKHGRPRDVAAIAKQLPGNLALRRRAVSNMRAGDSVSQNRRARIVPGMTCCTFTLPIKCTRSMNSRGHSFGHAKQTKADRSAARNGTADESVPPLPVTITLTRLGPGNRKLDSDNLPGSAKAVRDGIADAYGVDDGDPRYRWEYAQERSKTYGVRVEIRAVQP